VDAQRKRTTFSVFSSQELRRCQIPFVIPHPRVLPGMPPGPIGMLSSESVKEMTSTPDSQSPIDDYYPEFQKVTSPIGESHTSHGLVEATVPPGHTHRTLVLCFDGTGTISRISALWCSSHELLRLGDQFDDDVFSFL